jgi:photosystem II stability/assembly factor-like uncharacterized protein
MTMTRRLVTVTAGALLLAGSCNAVAAAAAASAAPAVGPVPKGFEPISMTFVSASEGWVLGTAPCAHKPCTSVVRTTNGGRNWVGLPAPKAALSSFPGTTGLDRIRFADASDGFAYGSQLWVTHNGGAGWYRLRQVPGYISDLEASAGVVYAASNRSGRMTIYRSPAGVDSWQKVTGLPVLIVDNILNITLHGTAAWIALGNRLYYSPTGQHWVRLSLRCPSPLGLASVAAYNARRVSALCSGDVALGSSGKVLYTSGDAGVHFTKAGDVPLGGDGGVLAQPGPRHLFVATSSGATWLYESTDGGKRWTVPLSFGDGGKGWADFGFTTATQGVAVEGTPAEGSHMYMTTDGGAHWHKVTF